MPFSKIVDVYTYLYSYTRFRFSFMMTCKLT